jgi:hypothetical protein
MSHFRGAIAERLRGTSTAISTFLATRRESFDRALIAAAWWTRCMLQLARDSSLSAGANRHYVSRTWTRRRKPRDASDFDASSRDLD